MMPRATYNHTTPEPRAVHYVRATQSLTVTLHQPVAPGEVRTIAGRVLGAMHVDGRLHHHRVEAGGTLFLVPPEWIEPLPSGGERLKADPVRAEVAA